MVVVGLLGLMARRSQKLCNRTVFSDRVEGASDFNLILGQRFATLGLEQDHALAVCRAEAPEERAVLPQLAGESLRESAVLSVLPMSEQKSRRRDREPMGLVGLLVCVHAARSRAG
jgi:hypothetical protein